MKKQLLPFILVLFITSAAHAQTGPQVGLNFGFNSVWIVNQNNYGYQELEYSRTFGINGGLGFGYNFEDTYGARIEINFVQMGQNYFDVAKDFGPPDTVENKQTKVDTYRYISLNYLQIPLMFRYQTKRDKKHNELISFHFMGGPVLAFLMSADQYYEADTAHDKNLVILDNDTIPGGQIPAFAATNFVEEDKEYFSGFELGFQINVGVDIYLTKQLYVAPAVKVYYGLTDLNSAPTRDIPDYKGASHNFTGGINVGVFYNIGDD